MGFSSIDTDFLEQAIKAATNAIANLEWASNELYHALDDVWLDTLKVSRWREKGEHFQRLLGIKKDLPERWDIAHQMEVDQPMIGPPAPGVRYRVTVDEGIVADQDGARIAELLDQIMRGMDVPQELLDLVGAASFDSTFAIAVAQMVTVQQWAGVLGTLGSRRSNIEDQVTQWLQPSETLTDFDDTYDHELTLVGSMLSLAARSMDSAQLAELTTQFTAMFSADYAGNAPPQIASLIIGRGCWPDSFLTAVTDAILADDRPAGWWATPELATVIDPTGDPTSGGPAQISAQLEHVMIDRGLDDQSWSWFAQASGTAILWDAQQQGTGEFASGVAAGVEYWQRQWIIDRHKTVWEKHKHEILMTVGLALAGVLACAGGWPGWAIATLVIADAGLTVADAVEYFTDGDTTNGLIGLGLVLLPVAIGGVAKLGQTEIRWIKLSQADQQALDAGMTIDKESLTITPNMWDEFKANLRGERSTNGVEPSSIGPEHVSTPPYKQSFTLEQFNEWKATLATRDANYGSPEAKEY